MQLISHDGALLQSDVFSALSQHSRAPRDAAGGQVRSNTPWDAVPRVDQWHRGGDDGETMAEGVAGEGVAALFEGLSERSARPAIARMLHAAETEDAQSDGGPRRLGGSAFLSSVLSPCESIATFAIVDASSVNAASARGGASSSGGVSLLPAHVLHTYLDAYTSSEATASVASPLATFHAAASPRRTLQTPSHQASHGMIQADRVLGFEVKSLSPQVVAVLSPLVAHWILVGSSSECTQALRTIVRNVSALRAAACPVSAPATSNVSVLVVAHPAGDGRRSTDASLVGETETDFAQLAAALSTTSPVVVHVAADGNNKGQRGSGSSASVHHQQDLLVALRSVTWLTKPLHLTDRTLTTASGGGPVSLHLLSFLLYLACHNGGSVSTSVAVDLVVRSAVTLTAQFHKYLLCEALETLSRNALLANRYGSVEDVDALIRRSSRRLFHELCGALSPSAQTIDAMDERLSELSQGVQSDLRSEAFHIAQSSVAASVRSLANGLAQNLDQDVLQWTDGFATAATQFVDAPLLRAEQRDGVGNTPAGFEEENLLTRLWASGAKRSALVDILLKWFLPNTKLLIHGQQERHQLRERQMDDALRAAHQRATELEASLATEVERSKQLGAQLSRVHTIADGMQETQNSLQNVLMDSVTSTTQRLRDLQQARAREQFLEENLGSGDDDAAVPHGGGRNTEGDTLRAMIDAALRSMEQCLQSLDAPTHGLLIESAPRGGGGRGPQRNSDRSMAHRANNGASISFERVPTPNASVLSAGTGRGTRGLNRSTQAAAELQGGVVRSPKRGGAAAGPDGQQGVARGIQEARRTAELEHAMAAEAYRKETTPPTSFPTSPITPTVALLPSFSDDAANNRRKDADLVQQEHRVHASMAAVTELQQRTSSLREQLTVAQRQHRELETRLRDAILEAARTRDDYGDLQQAHAELNANLQSTLRDYTQERDAHEATSTTLRERLDDLRHTNGLLDASRMHVERLEQEVQTLTDRGQRDDEAMGRVRSALSEAERRCELLSVESAMHASSAQQFEHQLLQVEKTLQHERTEKRETVHRYEHRAQELMSKLDDTVHRYEQVVKRTALEAESRIDALTTELGSLRRAHGDAENGQRTAAVELDDVRQRLEVAERELETSSKQRDEGNATIAKLQDQCRALDIKHRTAVEDLRSRDACIVQLREELRQSKEARRMLCHSMESLEMFIQEQKALSGEEVGSGGMPVATRIASANVDDEHSLLEPQLPRSFSATTRPSQLPEAMSVIRSVAESISRDETNPQFGNITNVAAGSTADYAANRSHNASTTSSKPARPISLSQLMRDQSLEGDQLRATPPAASSEPPTFVPLYVPPAPRNRSTGARPLGPHLHALAAIDAFLETGAPS